MYDFRPSFDDPFTDIYSAFGHPLGATGARQVVTALSELRRQNKRVAVTSMCVGTVCDIPPKSSSHACN